MIGTVQIDERGNCFGFIFTADRWPELFGFSLRETASEAVLGAETVAAMLRKAGAPKPVKLTSVGRLAKIPAGKHAHNLEIRVAITTLQRFLPELITDWREVVDIYGGLPPQLASQEQTLRNIANLEALLCLQKAIEGVAHMLPPRAKKATTAHWQFDALALLEVYREIIGDPECGASADGPAVGFVQAGLKELTAREHEKDAIEAAIRYRRKKLSRPR